MGGTTRTRRSRPVTRDENAYFLLKKKVGKENFHLAHCMCLLSLHSRTNSLYLLSYLFISYLETEVY